ncbi:MAG: hypothetical protein PHC75_01400 [Burkholderiales bacterium]|nr:hypothetical protein [Burkholderiales bacterium]
MRKLLIALIGVPAIAFAGSDLDMNNLKCNNLQIYSNTTLQQVRDNCLMYKQFERDRTDSKNFTSDQSKSWHGAKEMYEVQFYSTTAKDLVRCNFDGSEPNSLVIGCR